MNKNKKIIIGILIALIIVVGIEVAYKIIENSVTNRAEFNFKVEDRYKVSFVKNDIEIKIHD